MANYQVNVQDIVSRRSMIAHKVANKERVERFYHYVTDGIDLPVIRVDIGIPVYRVANYRTRTRQKAYVHTHSLANDFFQAGEENNTAQRAQHEILWELAKQGKGESIIPILLKLQQDQRQTETLLMTESGIVVNGNRRLAAMRELYAESPAIYHSFEQVQFAVLPASIMVSDLRKIEVQLQMQQDTKLPYDWTSECLAVRELSAGGMPRQEIMRLMRLTKEADVQARIDRLNEAESYLTDYLGNPDDYDAIEDQEQQFIELQKALSRKQDAGEKELARRMCYVLTKNSQDSVVEHMTFASLLGSKTKVVAERLAERMHIALPVPTAAIGSSNGDSTVVDDDLFDASGESDIAKYELVKSALMDKTKSKELAKEIRDICIEITEEDEDQDNALRALKELRKARGALARIDINGAGTATFADVREELNQICGLVEAMLAKLDERTDNNA